MSPLSLSVPKKPKQWMVIKPIDRCLAMHVHQLQRSSSDCSEHHMKFIRTSFHLYLVLSPTFCVRVSLEVSRLFCKPFCSSSCQCRFINVTIMMMILTAYYFKFIYATEAQKAKNRAQLGPVIVITAGSSSDKRQESELRLCRNQ